MISAVREYQAVLALVGGLAGIRILGAMALP